MQPYSLRMSAAKKKGGMKSSTLAKLEFDEKARKFIYRGDCLKMHPLCQAKCCSQFTVDISAEEYASGQYRAKVVCLWTDKSCRDESLPCLYRRYRLEKRADNRCVYLKGCHCGIYERRPSVCRKFNCKGVYLEWLLRGKASLDRKIPGLDEKRFIEKLSKDMTFVPHPLIKVHSVVYLKRQKKILFVKEMIGPCGKISTHDSFNLPKVDDAQLEALIGLFGRKETLHQTFNRFCSLYPRRLRLQDFFAVVWLLNKHSVIMDSSNFQGRLGGFGRIG